MPGQKENYFVYADPAKCLGCKSCELACGLEHAKADLFAAVLAGLPVQPRNRVVEAAGIRTPIQCRQCEEAPCALVCPSGAISREEGMIWLDKRLCFGCKSCVMVCPFGAIQVRDEGKAMKCDLCVDSPAEISASQCACIRACPTKAISLVDSEELRQKLMAARVGEIAQARAVDKPPAV
ncbi:MAG: 4Fe-4S dicluster domain-containing protein [Firmicutes bacterium]|nr:4Fe-4S dicluster domain-containing protein [Bacillota bacterium]HPU01651.1 4Fe-4S dicluster domain-containing protein [Bacillota bacterium]